MQSGKRESGGGVVKCRRREKRHCCMAVLTGVLQADRNVIDRRDSVHIVSAVAGVTITWRVSVAGRMALRALKVRVLARQRETGRAMIE